MKALIILLAGMLLISGCVFPETDLQEPLEEAKEINLSEKDLNFLNKISQENRIILSNQQVILNSLTLNELGMSGCVISNSFQIDQNTLGVSLLCPSN